MQFAGLKDGCSLISRSLYSVCCHFYKWSIIVKVLLYYLSKLSCRVLQLAYRGRIVTFCILALFHLVNFKQNYSQFFSCIMYISQSTFSFLKLVAAGIALIDMCFHKSTFSGYICGLLV